MKQVQSKTLSAQQINNFMKRFHTKHPSGRWDPHYFDYIAHDTQRANFHRQEVSQFEFHFFGGDTDYDLLVGTQDYPGYDNQTRVTFQQTFPQDQAHLIFKYQDIPTVQDIHDATASPVREALLLSRKLLQEIDKKCVTK